MNRNAITAAQKWVFSALLHDLNELCWILGHPVDEADTERLFSTNQALLALLEYSRPSWASLNRYPLHAATARKKCTYHENFACAGKKF